MKKILVGCAMVALLAGCNVTNQQRGGLLGAGAGGLLGSQIGSGTGRLVSTCVGVLLGTMAGSAIGQNMDQPRTTTVIYKNGNAALPAMGPCDNITNAGVRSSCQRGLADRRAAEQRSAEQSAYACSRFGRC